MTYDRYDSLRSYLYYNCAARAIYAPSSPTKHHGGPGSKSSARRASDPFEIDIGPMPVDAHDVMSCRTLAQLSEAGLLAYV